MDRSNKRSAGLDAKFGSGITDQRQVRWNGTLNIIKQIDGI
jgi:hypothetical protein